MTPAREIIAQRNERIYGDRMDPAHKDMDDMAEFGVTLNQREGYHRIPCCNGPCEQGRGKCPHPEACQLPEKSEDESLGAFAWPVKSILAIVACALVVNLSSRLWGGA
jgi:hypothetical protein